jgi:LysR family transcriptional regulator, hydrogen peroxide-inducible genes activator
MITIKQLDYALAVEKTLHFRKAAESCHVSQSALSTALSDLERQLGLQIFERDNKKVLLTPIGKEVLNRARNIFSEIESLQDLAEGQKAPLSFPIKVGAIPTIAPYILPRIFPLLEKEFPLAEINIIEEESAVLVDRVRSGEIDTAMIALPYPCDGLLTLDFWQEDFYWISAKGSEHADKKEISSQQVSASKLMLLKEGHCLKDHILETCKISEKNSKHGFGAMTYPQL